MKTKAINFLSDTGLGFLRWMKNNVLEQEPKPVAGVRVIRFIVVCAIGYVCAFCFVLLLRGGV
jgi:hypothetical protein